MDKTDVAYADRDGKPLLLDLHIPEGSGPFPAAILVHGGGFDGGHKNTNVKPLFQPLADAGFAWFSIDYRLAPAAQFPQTIQDVRDAIHWVDAHAAEYHVDRRRIALIGESAGGLLVNYIGTYDASQSGIAAVVDFYGPSDYGKLALARQQHPENFDMKTANAHAANGGGIHFFGVHQLDDAGLRKLHSLAPIGGVHKGMPPFLIIHGTKDDQVSFDQSTDFCKAIQSTGTECRLVSVDGGGHGMSRWKDPAMQHWKADMIDWLKQQLHTT